MVKPEAGSYYVRLGGYIHKAPWYLPKAVYMGCCPGVTYVKDARFVPAELKEQWPPGVRAMINRCAEDAAVSGLVQLSHAVVEAGVYDAPTGTALVLANFTYEPIQELGIQLHVPGRVTSARSVTHGPLPFQQEGEPVPSASRDHPVRVTCETKLGLSDILLFSTVQE
jgi:hypothetical protein